MSDYATKFPVGNRICSMFASACNNAPNGFLNSLTVQWSPDTPTSLSPSERAQYVNGRGNFLAQMNNQLIPLSIRVET